MNVLTANVNGLTSALRNGFFELDHVHAADVLCLQETRCDDAAAIVSHLGYEVCAADRRAAADTGTALHGGVAILSRLPMQRTHADAHAALADRGQFVAATIDGLTVASMYVTLDARPEQFLAFDELFAAIGANDAPALMCGDMNTFRDARDAWCFADTLERRGYGCDAVAMRWFAGIFNAGWIDAIELDWQPRPLYTWWARSALHDRGGGTRLDYMLASAPLQQRIVRGSAAVKDENRFGGHAQLGLSIAPA